MGHNGFDTLELSRETKSALDAAGYVTMTSCQAECIPLLCAKRDVILQSPTGTGKTLAYVVPCLESTKSCIHTLIIVPTRELAMQIRDVILSLGDVHRPVALTGGVPIDTDLVTLGLDPRIVVATPGRLLEILKTSKSQFRHVEYLILDEADKLLNLGFSSALALIMSFMPASRTTGLFSATLDPSMLDFSKINLQNPVTVDLTSVVPKMVISYVRATGQTKLQYLKSLLAKQVIVFFTTCASVDFFHLLFTKIGYNIKKIHGKMPQAERAKVYDATGSILFCTDVAARGIDFKGVELVIHFEVPTDPANFLHRSGRTARNSEAGDVLLMLMDNEMSYVDYLKVKNIAASEVFEDGCVTFTATRLRIPSVDQPFNFAEVIDEDILKVAVTAFVSYIRAYKEHILNFILNYRDLNFDELASLHFLRKIPRMDELCNVSFSQFKCVKSEKKQLVFMNRKKGNCFIKKKVIRSSNWKKPKTRRS